MTVFDWPVWALIVFAYIILQRLAELAYASANTRRLLAEGGREHGAQHYPLFIVLHSGWLIAIILFAKPETAPNLLGAAHIVSSSTPIMPWSLWRLRSCRFFSAHLPWHSHSLY
jgi:isoprenylcysteine carboxyl methyltransferase (ICMT) family protein YpbQ